MLDNLTVFIIKSGNNPCFPKCYEAIKQQSLQFTIKVIKDIFPMSLAFQKMIDNCTTEFFIQVDEDMVLYKNAVQLLYSAACNSDSKDAICCYKLYDVHSSTEIYGVKIYKTVIMKKYPYNFSAMSCEVEQLARMAKDGYKVKLLQEVIGSHGPDYTPAGIFEHYKNLLDKYKEFKYPWIGDLPNKLVSKVKESPTDQNIYALLGAYTSIISNTIQEGEKDFRNRLPELEEFESYRKPTSGVIYTTFKCNFKCYFCQRRNKDFVPGPDISLGTARKLIDKFPTIRGVCLAGFGEPFLLKDLFEIVKMLHSESKYVGIISNGSLIEDRFEEMIEQKGVPDRISISLNASTPEKHKEVTGMDAFEKVIRGIKLLTGTGVETDCSFVCTKQNIEEVPEFLKLVRSLGVKHVDLINILPHLSSSYDDANFWNTVLTVEDIDKIKRIRSLTEAYLINNYPVLLKKGDVRFDCRAPWEFLCIDGDNNVSFCPSVYLPSPEKGKINDFNVWHNQYAVNLRKGFCEKNINDTCKMCFRNYGNRILDIPHEVIDDPNKSTEWIDWSDSTSKQEI